MLKLSRFAVGNLLNGQNIHRFSSSVVNIQAQGNSQELYENARPYKEIPGPNILGLLRGFFPGGNVTYKFIISINMVSYREITSNICII